jgi:hypothetical protein
VGLLPAGRRARLRTGHHRPGRHRRAGVRSPQGWHRLHL